MELVGRKLPTAYTSQQLLRWLRPKWYIFSYFLLPKNTKKYVHIDTTHVACWHWISCPLLMSEIVKNLEILGHQKSTFELSKIVLFGQFPEKSRNPEIVRNRKNQQKSQKSQKSRKLRKCRIFGTLKATIRNLPKSLSGAKIQKISTFPEKCDFLKFVSGHEFCRFPEGQKKCENFEILTPRKIGKIGLYAVGTTRRKWRHISLRGGKKIVNFQRFSRIKEKNVPFSAILTVFVISRFFSKFDRFEGQCQRRPPKGSPSCPVIFHQGGNWKWSISTRVGPIFRTWHDFSGPDTKSTGLLRTCPLWCQVRKPRADQSGPSEPGIASGSHKSGLAPQVRKSRNPVRSWKSRKSQKSRLFRKTRDFSDFLDFRIRQDFGWSAPHVYFGSMFRSMCALLSRNSVLQHAHCTFERAYTHWHTTFVSECKLMSCINLVLICTILHNRALWK